LREFEGKEPIEGKKERARRRRIPLNREGTQSGEKKKRIYHLRPAKHVGEGDGKVLTTGGGKKIGRLHLGTHRGGKSRFVTIGRKA